MWLRIVKGILSRLFAAGYGTWVWDWREEERKSRPAPFLDRDCTGRPGGNGAMRREPRGSLQGRAEAHVQLQFGNRGGSLDLITATDLGGKFHPRLSSRFGFSSVLLDS